MEALKQERNAILAAWLEAVVQGYAEQTSRFLTREQDPFRNPVGDALHRGLPLLLDHLLGQAEPGAVVSALEEIMKIRAVQDFSPAQAAAFIFQLKPIVRDTARCRLERFDPEELEAFEDRTDETALLAFDLYAQCREKMSEIKVNEMKRRIFLLERVHPYLAPSTEDDPADGPLSDELGGKC